VPAGEHHIRFEFAPDTLRKTEPISFLFIFIMYGTIVGGIVYAVIKARKKMKDSK
jgi:hypothetical protein